MLSRHGWLTLLAGVALIVVARAFGVIELYYVAAAAFLLVIASLIYVRVVSVRLAVRREVHPTRVHAGTTARVEVHATNVGSRRTPLLRLRDPVTNTRGAVLHVAALAPGAVARAAYRLPTAKRGIVEIGPFTVEIADPFGLASVSMEAAGVTALTVYPAVETIEVGGNSRGRDPHAGTDHPNAIARLGEDFYALRAYEVGDDLRRVHWPSTARQGELMVRQDELPWQGRSTVLLDLRKAAHTDETLEAAVSAAATIANACWRRRDLVRLVTTTGLDTGFGAAAAHIESVMEHLATADVSSFGSLKNVVDALHQAGGGGALFAIVGAAPAADVEALLRLRRRFGSVNVVTFGRSAEATTTGADGYNQHTRVVHVNQGESFARTWNKAASERRAARRASVDHGTERHGAEV